MAPHGCHLRATSHYSSVEPPRCLSPSLLAVESPLHELTEWLRVFGEDGVFVYYVCVWVPKRLLHPLPHWEGEGKTELLWDQSERCFLFLSISPLRNTRWVSSQTRLEQLLLNNLPTARDDPGELTRWQHLVKKTENVQKWFERVGKKYKPSFLYCANVNSIYY